MVVFFDIDGTIVHNESQKIPESTLRAVRKLGENGHIAVVNTGRPYSHIDPRVRDMAFAGWVCGCGMEICLNGAWLRRTVPDQALCDFTVEQVRRCGMKALYEADDGSLVLDGIYSDTPSIRYECSQMKDKGFAIRTLAEHPRFMKLITFDGEDCRREAFLEAMAPHFTCIDRGNTMLELVMKGCSKAEGMTAMLEALGASPEDTVAIGDSTNDLPMFSVARHRVCMGNGMEALKAAASYVTDTVENDGVAKALEHFGLI